jgi:hypothetical protein
VAILVLLSVVLKKGGMKTDGGSSGSGERPGRGSLLHRWRVGRQVVPGGNSVASGGGGFQCNDFTKLKRGARRGKRCDTWGRRGSSVAVTFHVLNSCNHILIMNENFGLNQIVSNSSQVQSLDLNFNFHSKSVEPWT